MSNRRLSLATLTALAIVGAASGAGAADVNVSFTVNAAAGGLTLSSAAATANAGSSNYSAGSTGAITGDVPSLTLTDARGTLITGWTLQASATAFDNSGPAANKAVVFFPVANAAALITGSTLTGMNLLTCACSATGATALAANNLGSAYNLATGIATSLLSTPSAVVAPDIYIQVPANTPVGTYTSTVTFTLS